MGSDIPSNSDDVTGTDTQERPTSPDPMQTEKTTEGELDPATKKGFQVALQKKSESLKQRERELAEKDEELANLKEEKRIKKLQEMDETERLAAERDSLAEENAKLKMSQFALKELNKRAIPLTDAIAEIVLEAPWTIPFVRRSLGDSPSWADVIRTVETRLPSYLDSLKSKNGEHREETTTTPPVPPSSQPASSAGSDVERPAVATQKRIWTRKEIRDLSDTDWLKYRDEIKQATAEARVVA